MLHFAPLFVYIVDYILQHYETPIYTMLVSGRLMLQHIGTKPDKTTNEETKQRLFVYQR